MPITTRPVPDCRKPYPDPALACWRLPLTLGKTALIDEADVEKVSARRWRWAPLQGEAVYSQSRQWVPLGLFLLDAPKGTQVIHRNFDPLDYRRANLLAGNRSAANAAARKRSDTRGRPCSSSYKGVCLPRDGKRWMAYITGPDGRINLGTHPDEYRAAKAYDDAARRIYGDFARLNLPSLTPVHGDAK